MMADYDDTNDLGNDYSDYDSKNRAKSIKFELVKKINIDVMQIEIMTLDPFSSCWSHTHPYRRHHHTFCHSYYHDHQHVHLINNIISTSSSSSGSWSSWSYHSSDQWSSSWITFHQTCCPHKVFPRNAADPLYRTGGEWKPLILISNNDDDDHQDHDHHHANKIMTMVTVEISLASQISSSKQHEPKCPKPALASVSLGIQSFKKIIFLQMLACQKIHHHNHLHLTVGFPVDVLDIMGALSVTVPCSKTCSHTVSWIERQCWKAWWWQSR